MSALTQRESVIEADVSRYAVSKGVLTLKLNVSGRRGWPDRIYLFNGRVMFIEFKRQGEQPRKLQEYVHGQLRQHGFGVFVVDNLQQGRDCIDNLTQVCADL